MLEPRKERRSIRDIFRSHAVLDSGGRHVGGTDKQSNHNYGDAYEALFGDTESLYTVDRDAIRLVMEVGVADGACLQAWAEVFPNARIVGMDIHPSVLAKGDRIEFHLGDQSKLADCMRAANGRMFDLIVEDATHKLEDTLRTMFYLWPCVKPGGLYVIEEFENIGELRHHIIEVWPEARIVDTDGPHGGQEPLVVLRKPLR